MCIKIHLAYFFKRGYLKILNDRGLQLRPVPYFHRAALLWALPFPLFQTHNFCNDQ